MKLPKVKWVVFQDNETLGMFFPCNCGCKSIILDCLKLQSFSKRLGVVAHEFLHYSFYMLLPSKLYNLASLMLDMTDGNQPELYFTGYTEEDDTVVLHEW